MTDSVTDSVGLDEKPKLSTKMILCAVLEAVRVAISMHCDDGWFTMMEAECQRPWRKVLQVFGGRNMQRGWKTVGGCFASAKSCVGDEVSGA